MAIVVKFDVTGMDAKKYDGIIRDLEAAGLGHPDGRSYHVCFGAKDRLQVIDVFENPATLEASAGADGDLGTDGERFEVAMDQLSAAAYSAY